MRKLKLEELNRLSVEDYRQKEKIPVAVVLDNIRSAVNVGAVFRTADAFAIEKIVLCGISATPPSREITKTAIGATESVSWQYIENIKEAISQLKSEGYIIIGVEQTDQTLLLQEFKHDGSKMAIVFGNEVEGISDEIIDELDICVEIPQFGTKHSLNVSVCVGIVLWEVRKNFSL
jgi:tRNA G18 (ribose-2'-O)-methylase SpoU